MVRPLLCRGSPHLACVESLAGKWGEWTALGAGCLVQERSTGFGSWVCWVWAHVVHWMAKPLLCGGSPHFACVEVLAGKLDECLAGLMKDYVREHLTHHNSLFSRMLLRHAEWPCTLGGASSGHAVLQQSPSLPDRQILALLRSTSPCSKRALWKVVLATALASV